MLGIYCRTSIEVDIENSTIFQQQQLGIKFAEENNFEYEIYADEGKSGFKITDDDLDPINNRPEFKKLINDIKDGKIDKVWVWEHSRLSRNQYASAFIFNVFEKNNITLFINQKKFDMNDPQIRFTRQILDAVSEYERQLIVARTTRGLRKRIDEGKRAYPNLYGYMKDGRDEKGYIKWTPVESEIENYKYMMKMFQGGATLRKITLEVFEKEKIKKKNVVSYSSRIGGILRGYQYTGYQLTIEGKEIYKQFRKNEIASIQILLDRKYWVKSVPYPLELISIEDWVNVCERLQIRGMKISKERKERILRASRDIATGLIICGDCEHRFYYKEQKVKDKRKKEKYWIYRTYFHHQFFNNKCCSQKPKSFNIEYINEIFKIFYFFFKLVFDNKNELINESMRTIKQTQLKLKESMARIEMEIPRIRKLVIKFTKAMEKDDADISVLSRQIGRYEDNIEELEIELSKLKINYELEIDKFNKAEREIAYYDVKEKINDWFYNMNIEEQRNELIRIIIKSVIFAHYLIIDIGKIVFLFDINQRYVFDIKLLENLNKDELYKKYFIEMKGGQDAKKYDGKRIPDVKIGKNEKLRMRVFQYLIKTYNITYDLSEKTNIVPFVSMSGLYGFDLEQFRSED